MSEKMVIFGAKPVETSGVVVPFCRHWAIQVDGRWYEVDKSGTSIVIKETTGSTSQLGADGISGGFLGSTQKTFKEIDNFNRSWKSTNPIYDALTNNCQTYAVNFGHWLCGGDCKFPPLDAGVVQTISGPSAFAVDTPDIATTGIETVNIQAQIGPLGGKASGPSAGASALASDNIGYGGFVDAAACELRSNIGPANVGFRPNIDTGAGVRKGAAEGSVLGFGIRLGWSTLKIKSPLFDFGFGE